MVSTLSVAATVLLAAAPAPGPSREIDNVAAFARLYGVVRFFYPSDAAAALDWDRFAVHGVSRVRAARSRAELEGTLERLVGPLGSGIQIGAQLSAAPAPVEAGEPLVAWRYLGAGFSPMSGAYKAKRTHRAAPASAAGAADVELFPEGAPTPGAHADLDMGAGLRARVPIALTDAQARPDPARKDGLDALRTALSAASGPSDAPDVDLRLADVVVAWNVLRHFYPYWTEAGVEWDDRLRPRLEEALAAQTRKAQHDALLGLVADARDGHGSVEDTRERTERGWLPIGLAAVQGQVVVASSDAPAEAAVGAVVAAVDGVPARDRLARAMALASGSPQWREVKALWALANGPRGTPVRLGLDGAAGPREVALTYDAASPPPSRRSDALAELQPGIWYVDLTRAKMADIAPRLETLAAARGVVFDLRGYPTDAGFGLLPHLLDRPETDRWMHVARLVGPFYETAGWQDLGWDAKPRKPRIAGHVVFLTDGRAISYAESVMGYVADRKLGTIVGGTTAGTNGNVASFLTPGGFSVAFTGMRVTRHDGRSPHHLAGVEPDVRIAPTLDGLRAGRDEVLERGLAIARSGAMSPSSPGPPR